MGSRPIKELDDDLLAHLGGSWDSPPVLVPGWEPTRRWTSFGCKRRRSWGHVRPGGGAGRTDRMEGSPALVVAALLADGLSGRRDGRDRAEPIRGCRVLEERNEIDATQRICCGSDICWPRSQTMTNRTSCSTTTRCSRIPSSRCVPSRYISPSPLPTTTSQGRRRSSRPLIATSPRRPVARRRPTPVVTENPVLALAQTVWNGGAVSVDALDATVRQAIEQGWLRHRSTRRIRPGTGAQRRSDRAPPASNRQRADEDGVRRA